MDVCALASGGIDSDVLLGDLLRRGLTVHPLYIRSGLSWERAELYWLKRYLRALRSPFLKPLAVLRMPVTELYGDHWSLSGRGVPGRRSRDSAVYLPGRNLLLLAQAAVFCARRRIPDVYLGTLAGNPFPDASPSFFKAAERSAREALQCPFRIHTPFRSLAKRDILERGAGLPLHLAFSCLSPRGHEPCRKCNKCAERDKALKAR